MKVFVLLSLVALCYSTQINGGRYVTVDESGLVKIMCVQGKQEVLIYRNTVNPEKLDIILRSPMGILRKIEVDQTNNIIDADINVLDKLRLYPTYYNTNIQTGQLTQADILAQIFRQYEGLVQEPTYQAILNHIQTLVNSGLIHETVYDVLRNLEHIFMIEELKREQLMNTEVVRENWWPKMLTRDVYPRVNEDIYLHQVSDVKPIEYLRGINDINGNIQYRNLEWNMENMTPYQRMQMLLQQIKQQRQIEQIMETEILKEKLLEEELAQKEINMKYYQTYPMNNLMTMLREQQYIQHPQVYQQRQMDLYNIAGQNRMIQGQEYTQNQMTLNKLAGLERLVQQGQILPQEYNLLRQYHQEMML